MTTPEVSAIRDADRIIGLLESGGLRDIRLIINRLRPEMIARGDMMSVEDVLEILAVDLIGAILDDEQIVISTNQENLYPEKIPRQKKSIAISAGGLWAKRSLMLLCVEKWCIPPSWQHFSKITDALLSDIFHHRRNDYGIFSGKNHSAGYARDRMKLLLVSERIDCSPQMMKLLRNDLIHAVKNTL